MGIFDSYFDPSTYQGGGSGMIDRLMAQLQTQSQYQPSQGFPGAPMNANAAMPAQAAPQNDPIAVGNYQMPRIGAGFPEEDSPLPRQSAQEQAAGQLPAPMQQLPPQLQQPSTSGFGDHISAGLHNLAGNLHNGLIGSLLSGISGFATGERNDPQAVAQQTVRQTYQALIAAGIPEPKARLAAINPEYGKSILADALGKTYNFTTLPDGTVVRQDPKNGTVEPVYSGGTKPTFGIIGEQEGGGKQYGWIDAGKRTVVPLQGSGPERGDAVTGPDGKLIQIPPGVDRKTFVNEISKTNADAATGKMTEVQAKASSYAARMELAEKTLKSLAGEGSSFWNRLTETTPLIGGTAATTWMQSNDYQKYRQARDNFISGVLRQESGAAIAPSEFTRTEKEYFPQPGDSGDTVAQKAKARAVVIEQMKRAAGPGYKSQASAVGDAPKSDPLGIR
ncbi:hypothetical protein AB8Z38_06765 [Bradyrhizobium sp. LLZ17]|uniref:Uncharacterized protein n=1 Tax=Bradyrhizobium sp. LLZ17 TaxID=3239388 RepID=A0AB39XPH7_9BRAD